MHVFRLEPVPLNRRREAHLRALRERLQRDRRRTDMYARLSAVGVMLLLLLASFHFFSV
jgi:hypothetical protein